MNVIVPLVPPVVRVQEVKWHDYRQSSYYDFICTSTIEVCKRISPEVDEKGVILILDQFTKAVPGYFFIALDAIEPVGIASAYVSAEAFSDKEIFNEYFLHIPDYVPPVKAASVLNLLLKTLEQKTLDLGISSLCVSCSNKTSMEKYIRILLKKGFNVETITCRKEIQNG